MNKRYTMPVTRYINIDLEHVVCTSPGSDAGHNSAGSLTKYSEAEYENIWSSSTN